VPPSHLGGTCFLEPLDGEVADGLQHREARVAPSQEVVVDEGAEGLDVDVAHQLRRLERAAPHKDAEPREGESLARRQQVVAPVDRGRERALASRGIARPAREPVRLALEPLEDLGRREQFRPCRRELDGERQPVEPRADLGDLRRARRVELEARVDGTGARGEEPQRVGLDERLERPAGVGRVERRHRILALRSEP
jgi:hypothetical protein